MAKIDYKVLLEDAMQQRAEAEAVIAFAQRQLGIVKTPATTAGPAPERASESFALGNGEDDANKKRGFE